MYDIEYLGENLKQCVLGRKDVYIIRIFASPSFFPFVIVLRLFCACYDYTVKSLASLIETLIQSVLEFKSNYL